MQTYLCIIGRSPELSIEELIIVAKRIGFFIECTEHFVVLQGSIDPVALLPRLGGTIKIAEVEGVYDSWREVTKDHWLKTLRSELHDVTGKFNFGVSVYGAGDQARKHFYALGLSLKKHLKAIGIHPRLVSSKEPGLSSVIVAKNNLIGRELIIAQGKRCYIARTLAVQDFDAYGMRDVGRPSRNMQRGMLPPKLAQVLLNLAEVSADTKLLDPFCGGGTIMQEAVLMGLRHVWGSDVDPKAIDETNDNITWLANKYHVARPQIQVADALELTRYYPDQRFDAIVTEPYLGPARLLHQKKLTRAEVAKILADSAGLYNQCMRSMAAVANPGARAVVIFPMLRLFGERYMVGDLHQLERLGWKLVQPEVSHRFSGAALSPRGQLLYSREDQIVLREITVWERSR